jgi:hypothetical protein
LNEIRAACDDVYDGGLLTPDALRVIDSLSIALNGARRSHLYTKQQLRQVFEDVAQRALDQGWLTLEATAILGDVALELGVRPLELDVHSNQAVLDEIRAACFRAYRAGYFTPQVVDVVGMLFWALGIQKSSLLRSKLALSRVFADVAKQALDQGIFTADAKRIMDEVAWKLDFPRPDLPVFSDQQVHYVVGAACDSAHRSGALTREIMRSAVVLIRVLGDPSRTDLHTQDAIHRKIQFTLWYAEKLGYRTPEVEDTIDLIADTLGIERVGELPTPVPAAAEP